MYSPRHCRYCNKVFQPTRNGHVLCSDECRDADKKARWEFTQHQRDERRALGKCLTCGCAMTVQDRGLANRFVNCLACRKKTRPPQSVSRTPEVISAKQELTRLQLELSKAKNKLQTLRHTFGQVMPDNSAFAFALHLERGPPLDRITGIYFLLREKKVIYVGQSLDVLTRVKAHRSDKVFDDYLFYRCEKHELNKLESVMIHWLEPELNRDRNGKLHAPSLLSELQAS